MLDGVMVAHLTVNQDDGGSIPSGGTDRFPTRTSIEDCLLDRRVMGVQVPPSGPWQMPKSTRREAVNLVEMGVSPICRSKPP